MQLLYDKGERYYEDKDVYGATINDVDMNLVGDYVNVIGYGKSAMEYLRENNDFVTEVDGQQKISTACILLFGKNLAKVSTESVVNWKLRVALSHHSMPMPSF